MPLYNVALVDLGGFFSRARAITTRHCHLHISRTVTRKHYKDAHRGRSSRHFEGHKTICETGKKKKKGASTFPNHSMNGDAARVPDARAPTASAIDFLGSRGLLMADAEHRCGLQTRLFRKARVGVLQEKGRKLRGTRCPSLSSFLYCRFFFFLRLSRFSSLPFSGTLDDTESFRNYYSFTLESKMALQSTVTGTRNRQSGRPYPCLRVDATPFAFSHWATARRHPSFNAVCS